MRTINGTTRSDWLFGSSGAEHILAGDGNDVVFAGGGDDIINGGRGNDTIFGGAGIDTVELAGSYLEYSWSKAGGLLSLSGLLGPSFMVTGFDDSDRLFGVELLRFEDATVDLRTGVITLDNLAPDGSADSYAATEDTPLSIDAAAGVLANDSDPDNDALTAIVGSNPTNGTLVLNADGSFSYTPNANFNGADSFTYTPNDGTANGTPVTVTINIAAVNDDPTANTDSATTNIDTAIAIAVRATTRTLTAMN